MSKLSEARKSYQKSSESKAKKMESLIGELQSWKNPDDLSQITKQMRLLSLGLQREAYTGSSEAAEALSKYNAELNRLPLLQASYGAASSAEEYEKIEKKKKKRKKIKCMM